jgi:AraC-like DNA-binding protein
MLREHIEPLPDVAFRASLMVHTLRGIGISSHLGGGLRSGRTREIVSDARDEYLLIMNLRGPTVVTQRGQECVLGERTAMFATLHEAGDITRPTLDHHYHMLHIPRLALASLTTHADDALMRPLAPGSPALRLLIDYVAVLQRDGMLPDPLLRPLVAGHINDLVALTIGATRDAMEAARCGGIRAARLATIRADVLANLSDVHLSAKTVARRHGVSDRYIHLLFADAGQSFGHFVEEARLKRALRLLTHPTSTVRRIGEVATAAGFAEQSTFNRAFRRRFGDTPSGVRGGRKDGQPD